MSEEQANKTASPIEPVVMFDFKMAGEAFEATGDGWEYRGFGNRIVFIQHKKLPSIRTAKTLVKKLKSI